MINLKLLKTKVIDEAISLLDKYWAEPRHLKYFNANTIDEAVSLLSEYKEARILAGGVDLTRLMRNKVISPKVLVNIGTIPNLVGITEDAEGLKMGTLTSINDIETSALIKTRYSLLAEAAHSVSSPQIRNMATIGGNLCQDVNCWYYKMSPVTGRTFFCYRKGGSECFAVNGDNRYHSIIGVDTCHAVSQSDMAPALIALEAKVNIAGPSGERTIPVEALYQPLGTVLEPDEFITGIAVPAPQPQIRQQYLKFRLRKTIDPAISSVASAVTTDSGKVTRVRIVLGGVAPVPYRSVKAEEVLKGQVITEKIAETAADTAVSAASPLSMNAYKLTITRALVKRAILGQTL